jgi:CRISPR/Cas system CSM-associated protein Csm2 small subunit
MVTASQPVLQLAQSLVRAADAVGKGADSFAQSSAGALRQTEALAQALTRNQTALSAAWTAHKDRFESVDKDLARAVEQISGAIERNGRDVAAFVGAMDKEMQKVVDRLAEQLVPLSDYAEALEAYADTLGDYVKDET